MRVTIAIGFIFCFLLSVIVGIFFGSIYISRVSSASIEEKEDMIKNLNATILSLQEATKNIPNTPFYDSTRDILLEHINNLTSQIVGLEKEVNYWKDRRSGGGGGSGGGGSPSGY